MKDFYREEVGAKQGSYLTGCSLSGLPYLGKAELAICDWLSLGFDFSVLSHFRLTRLLRRH